MLIFISIIIILLLCYSTFIEPNKIKITKYHIENTKLKGLKIGFISDFHLKSNHQKRLKKIIKLLKEQNPDIILSTGDFMYNHKTKGSMKIETIAEELSKIIPQYGFYTVLGNHDWLADGIHITKMLQEKNINVLDNSNIRISLNTGESLYIAGVEDYQTKSPNINNALQNTNKSTILLTHNPDIFPQLTKKITLTLAGHTHGGQVRLPFIGAVIVPSKFRSKYAKGVIKENGNIMIVTQGLGNSILPFRFNCSPEIVLIEF